jgi:hypothetical protein
MSDVVLLRKLSRKSTLKFGKYSELTVQDVINLTKQKYLRWVYFNCSNINFMDDILHEINIPEKFRIDKPSKNPELHDELNQHIFNNISDKFLPKYLAKKQLIADKNIKSKAIRGLKKDSINYTKSAMQRLNQGH